MKQSIVLKFIALLLISTGASSGEEKAKPNPNINLHIAPEHAEGSYAVGENVTWNIKLSGVCLRCRHRVAGDQINRE